MPAMPMVQAVAATTSHGSELALANPEAATTRMIAEATAPALFRRRHWSNDARYTFPHSLHWNRVPAGSRGASQPPQ